MEDMLLDVAFRGAMMMALAGIAAGLLRHASAAVRHLVWAFGLGGLVALPPLSLALPRWGVPILPTGVGATGSTPEVTAAGAFDWGTTALTVWSAGFAVVIGTILVGRLRVWWLVRASEPAGGTEWSELVDEVHRRIGLSRPVRVRICRRALMPMVWGVTRPVVVLPSTAESWPRPLRRDVLLHELSHVARHDYAIQLVARLACAIHWFDPLAWIAARRLRIEREQACDDHVLRVGASPCDYAENLVAIARSLRPVGRSALALGMADTSRFAARIVALLDGDRNRRRLTRRLVVPLGLAAGALIVPLATVVPEASVPEGPAAVERARAAPGSPLARATARAEIALRRDAGAATDAKAPTVVVRMPAIAIRTGPADAPGTAVGPAEPGPRNEHLSGSCDEQKEGERLASVRSIRLVASSVASSIETATP